MAVAFLTPQALPAGSVRRVVLIPDDHEWLSLFYGAMLELCDPNNWEQFGIVTPEQAAERWTEVFDAFLQGEICP
jgi:hypothetical protein